MSDPTVIRGLLAGLPATGAMTVLETVCRENRIRELIPIPLTPYREAVTRALRGEV